MERNDFDREYDLDSAYCPRATCPYCGWEDQDSWELGESGEIDCPKCEKVFWYSTQVSREFFSYKQKPDTTKKEGV